MGRDSRRSSQATVSSAEPLVCGRVQTTAHLVSSMRAGMHIFKNIGEFLNVDRPWTQMIASLSLEDVRQTVKQSRQPDDLG